MKRIKIGDSVQVDATKASITQVIGNGGKTGTVKRFYKSGTALVEWRDKTQSRLPVDVLEKDHIT